MVIFGIELERTKEAIRFMDETKQRLTKNTNLVTNPFYGTIKRLQLQTTKYDKYVKDHYVLVMDPVHIKFYKIGFFLIAGAFFFKGFQLSYAYLPGLILLASSFFWSRFFMYLGLFFGLKKAGYKGRVKLLRDSTTLRDMLNEVI